jgi:O-antigen ligase
MTSANSMVSDLPLPLPGARLRQVAFVGLTLMVAAVQFSIAIAQIFLTLTLLTWAAALVVEHRRPSAPRWAIPLALYAGWTLLSASLSPDPRTSIIDCKQLILFLIVPLTFEIVDEESALPLTTIILAAGACSAVVGIGQYSILHYDNLGQRPRSTLGISLTFSGLLMLVLNLAVARVLFMTKSRVWPAVVMPALAVALALSFGRGPWVGWCCALAMLLLMRHLRLVALLPVIAAIFFALAPTPVIQRFYSIFDLNVLSNSDRILMLRAGRQIVAGHPIAGVGPNMIARVYPQYRSPDAVMQEPPHLHNVPMQIAAERGLPALGLWIWFIAAVASGSFALFRNAPREGPLRFLAAAALAAVVSMLGAGMFEYNFGDSEFLMLFLVLITIPFAVVKKRQEL